MTEVITNQPVPNSALLKTNENEQNVLSNGVDTNSTDPDALSEEEKRRRRRQQQCCCYIDDDVDFCCVSLFRCIAGFFQGIGECTDECCDGCASCLHDCCEGNHQDTNWGNDDTNYSGGDSCGSCCGDDGGGDDGGVDCGGGDSDGGCGGCCDD